MNPDYQSAPLDYQSNPLDYQSSPIDWCEDNYKISLYIVEFLNTFSNLPILYLAIQQYLHFKAIYPELNNGKLKWLHLCFIVIPCGSFVFHCSLSLIGQYFDELAILAFLLLANIGNDTLVPFIKLFLSITVLFFLPYYHRFMLMLSSLELARYYFKRIPKPDRYRSILYFDCSLFSFTFASLLWGIDIFLCNRLIISLHWLWHIFSGLGLLYLIRYHIEHDFIEKISF
jgi:hypothetical protein